MPFLGHLDINFIALQSLILIYTSRSFVSRVAPLPLLKFRLNESNGAHFRCVATDQKLAYGNFPRLLEVHAGSGSTRCSFFICRSRNCRMHGGTRALLQEWMFSWLQEFCMNIYERPSRPGRGGWNLCFPPHTSVLLSCRYAPFFLVATTEKLLFYFKYAGIYR